MSTLPARLRTRAVFAMAGGLLGGLFALILYGPGTYFLDDRMPGTLGAVLGSFVFAGMVWPKRYKSAPLMIILGLLVVLAAIFTSYFSVGFFSEREITSRADGEIGTWIGSFFGSWIMAVILGLFSLIGSAFLVLMAGGMMGWLFRDPKREV